MAESIYGSGFNSTGLIGVKQNGNVAFLSKDPVVDHSRRLYKSGNQDSGNTFRFQLCLLNLCYMFITYGPTVYVSEAGPRLPTPI